MEFKNDLGLVGKIAAHSVMSGKYKDKDGNIKEILPVGPGNSLDFDQFREDIGAFGGGSGGTDIDKEHPSAGANYYAGSLADGEITERYLLYQRDESVAEQTGSQTVTLLRDVGTKFNMAGDGATFLIHLQKTAMTKGAKGAVTDIELNYDPKNVAKNGYFTTTSPYPVYTKSADLATKKTLAIPINGIGENLSGKNVKAPQLNILFNGDGTMTFESVTGYDNDGDSTGVTGANYEVVVDAIATFSVQAAVAQLPASVELFNGSAAGDIALSGISKFFESGMDGIEITFDDYGYILGIMPNGIFPSGLIRSKVDGLSNAKIRIPKEFLMVNYNFDFSNQLKPTSDEVIIEDRSTSSSTWGPESKPGYKYYFSSFLSTLTKIDSSSININFQFYIKGSYHGNSGAKSNYAFTVNAVKVTPYKD